MKIAKENYEKTDIKIEELRKQQKKDVERISSERDKNVLDTRDALNTQNRKIENQNNKIESISKSNKDYTDIKTYMLQKDIEVNNAENKYEVKSEITKLNSIFQRSRSEFSNELEKFSYKIKNDIKSLETKTIVYIESEIKRLDYLFTSKIEAIEDMVKEHKKGVLENSNKIITLDKDLERLQTLLSKKVSAEELSNFRSEVKTESANWTILLAFIVAPFLLWLFQRFVSYRVQEAAGMSIPVRNNVQQIRSTHRTEVQQIGSPVGDTPGFESI